MANVAPREVTPPPIQAPSAKEKKYDRQLRLWAASGQKALEESHVLLVVGDSNGSNSSVAGSETLKNLILPSIGHFTVADSATVTEPDLGVNFFLEPSSLGKSRAEETTKYLQELNPDVEGHFISEPLESWLPKPDSLKPYNLLLICAPIPTDSLQRLSNYALDQGIPLVYIKSAGFYGTASVQLPREFPIVDTHPDPDTIQDLRLLAPWDELLKLEKDQGDLDKLDDHVHGHVPWLILLRIFLEEWKQTHEGKYPSNFKEKTAFRDFVSSKARRDNPEGGEENFDEACAAVLKSVNPPSIGSGCKEMFAMPSCISPTGDSADFWLIANAIKQFYDAHGVLPLSGGLPDMKATSAGYIRLQTVYKSKARSDAAEVTKSVRDLEAKLGRNSEVSVLEIEQFCKNASFVRVLTNSSAQPVPELRLLQTDHKTLAKLPAVLTGFQTISEVFLAMNIKHIPQSTLAELKALENMEGESLETAINQATEEATRYDGAEMHNTSSVMGGIIAQESIKLLTRQYLPVDGTVIWDGIRARTEVVKI